MKEKVPSPSIDTYNCNGCGSCAELCPAVFVMDADSGKAALVADLLLPLPACVSEAIVMCPCSCIEMAAS